MQNNQQSRRAPVAPFNPTPQWPQGYFRVLQALGVEKPRHSFYAHWVVNSSTNSNRTVEQGTSDEPKLMPFYSG